MRPPSPSPVLGSWANHEVQEVDHSFSFSMPSQNMDFIQNRVLRWRGHVEKSLQEDLSFPKSQDHDGSSEVGGGAREAF